MTFSVIVLSLLSVTRPVLNSSALGRFHSLNRNQCIGILGRFFLSELNQGSVDLKLPHLRAVAKEVRESKVCCGHIKKGEIIPGNLQTILEKSWNFVIGKKWELIPYG